MNDAESLTAGNPEETPSSRPFLLTLLCVFSIVFFGLLSILFLASVFYSGALTRVINQYMPENSPSHTPIFLLCLAGFCLHALALTGIVLIMKLKKTGYLLFGTGSLIICIYQLFQDKIPFATTSIYVLFIILFGIFYKKLK